MTYELQIKKLGVVLPNDVWVDLAWRQISAPERRIIGKKSDDLEELEGTLSTREPRDNNAKVQDGTVFS